MQQKKSINFGWRGWMLILWVATAFFSYVVIGNYPLNIMADFYGGAQTLSLIYTGASIVGIIVQLIFSRKAGAIKSWKGLGVVMGIVSIVCLVIMMLIPAGIPWLIIYGIGTAISALYGTWALSVLVGVWFPRRKGTVMGIITFAFPIGNALIGNFAEGFFGKMFASVGQGVDMAKAAQGSALVNFIPFLIVIIVGLLIGIIFTKDFPEQCGAYRDNDKSMTPEMAQKMMEFEETNRKTTVWTTAHTFKSPDFWLITIPMGLLLFFAVGSMTQTQAMISAQGDAYNWIGGYSGVMLVIAAFGIIGSYLFGLLDTKCGTKTAVFVSMLFMVVSGILGSLGSATPLFIAFILLGMFMGASSNYTVSAAVQYWRIEDFPSVFSAVNPIANLINAFGPTVVAALIATSLGTQAVFIATGIAGVVGAILCLLFKPARIKAYDDKYREAAGKPLDDVLVGRK